MNGFSALPPAQDWVQGFVRWYDYEHRHSGIRFVTPAERHAGKDTAILAQRHILNEQARARNRSRWSGKTRNWEPVHTVALYFGIDIETWPACGGVVRIIAFIEDPVVIQKILDRLKRKEEACGPFPLPESRARRRHP